MKERDNIRFYDTSALAETPGIRQRCRVDYVRDALQEKFPNEVFKVTSVSINETGSYAAKLNWLVKPSGLFGHGISGNPFPAGCLREDRTAGSGDKAALANPNALLAV